jgi:hypothetical protein
MDLALTHLSRGTMFYRGDNAYIVASGERPAETGASGMEIGCHPVARGDGDSVVVQYRVMHWIAEMETVRLMPPRTAN